MSAMDAVEIADGEHCAFCLRRRIRKPVMTSILSFLDERDILDALSLAYLAVGSLLDRNFD